MAQPMRKAQGMGATFTYGDKGRHWGAVAGPLRGCGWINTLHVMETKVKEPEPDPLTPTGNFETLERSCFISEISY